MGIEGEEEASLGVDGAAVTQEDKEADLAAMYELVDAEEAAQLEAAAKGRSGDEAAPKRRRMHRLRPGARRAARRAARPQGASANIMGKLVELFHNTFT